MASHPADRLIDEAAGIAVRALANVCIETLPDPRPLAILGDYLEATRDEPRARMARRMAATVEQLLDEPELPRVKGFGPGTAHLTFLHLLTEEEALVASWLAIWFLPAMHLPPLHIAWKKAWYTALTPLRLNNYHLGLDGYEILEQFAPTPWGHWTPKGKRNQRYARGTERFIQGCEQFLLTEPSRKSCWHTASLGVSAYSLSKPRCDHPAAWQKLGGLIEIVTGESITELKRREWGGACET